MEVDPVGGSCGLGELEEARFGLFLLIVALMARAPAVVLRFGLRLVRRGAVAGEDS